MPTRSANGIYDWTVSRNIPATPISEVAGDLWLLPIKIAGKMKRAQYKTPLLPFQRFAATL